MPKRSGNKVSQDLAGKPVSASRTEMTEVVLPQDANVFGNILGGRVMHLVDIAAAITAHRHCRSMAVTASVDHIDFRNPIRVGEARALLDLGDNQNRRNLTFKPGPFGRCRRAV